MRKSVTEEQKKHKKKRWSNPISFFKNIKNKHKNSREQQQLQIIQEEVKAESMSDKHDKVTMLF